MSKDMKEWTDEEIETMIDMSNNRGNDIRNMRVRNTKLEC